MSALVRTKDVEALRREVERSMTDVTVVYRVTHTSDGAGGQAETRTLVATTVSRLIPISDRALVIAGALREGIVEDRLLPAETDVAAQDVLVVGGQNYRVTGVMRRSPELSVRVRLTRL